MVNRLKINIHMRRFLSLAFCVLIVCACTVPAFAVENGYTVYPVIPIHKIGLARQSSSGAYPLYSVGLDVFKQGSTIPNQWTLAENLTNTTPDEYIRLQLSSVNEFSALINGQISSVDFAADRLVLYSYNVVCSVAHLSGRSSTLAINYYDTDLEDVVNASADWNITYLISRPVVTDNVISWVDETRTLSETTSSFDVCDAIYDSLPSWAKESDFVLLRSIRIIADENSSYDWSIPVEFQYDAAGTNEVSGNVVSAKEYTVADFLNQYTFYEQETVVVVDPADPSGVDFTDWLRVAVGGIIDFEVFPGLSFGDVFFFVLAVGVALWFIKLIS